MNPLANEGFLSKLTGKKKKETDNKGLGIIQAYLVGTNYSVRIVAEACSCCWDKKTPEDYEGLSDYVARRGRTGHTSIIEHSNHIILLSISNGYKDELISFLSNVHYLNFNIFEDTENDVTWLLIGGSYRGYSDIYRNIDDLSNPVLQAITGNLYTYAPSCMFEDIITLGILQKDNFNDAEPDSNFKPLSEELNIYECDDFKVLSADTMWKLFDNIAEVSKFVAGKITRYDLMKYLEVTILFKNMSRVITQQLCRHRNAITQESQRYVDYSKASFNDPCLFKPGRYDPDHKYNIRFGPSGNMPMTLEEIGEAIIGIYNQLHNPTITGKEFALMQEDARAFLPGNAQCRKIYITFTYKSLLKFLNLREDKAAQAEIRKYATEIGDWFRNFVGFDKETCDKYTLPRIMVEEEKMFSDVVSENETTEEITEEDYIKAMTTIEEVNMKSVTTENDNVNMSKGDNQNV